MSKSTDMSPAEFEVMKILWRLEQATVADVRAAAASDAAYTTVMTLLGRLEKKGAVTVDKTRQPFVYRPHMKRRLVLRRRLRAFLDSVFDGDADSMVMHLVAENAMTLEELRDLEARLAKGEDDEE